MEGLGAERRVLLALVLERDRDAAVEVRQLAHARRERVELVERLGEDGRVGDEMDRRAGGLALSHVAHAHQLVCGVAALEGHLVDAALALDLHLEARRERVDAAHADAVEPAGHLVGVLVELAAGVQHRHHHLDGRLALGRVHPDRDAAAVVAHRDRVVLVDRDRDDGAVARERLVDGVVYDLVDEVVQPAHADVADVHRGPLADRLEALEDLDVGRAVIAACRERRGERLGRRAVAERVGEAVDAERREGVVGKVIGQDRVGHSIGIGGLQTTARSGVLDPGRTPETADCWPEQATARASDHARPRRSAGDGVEPVRERRGERRDARRVVRVERLGAHGEAPRALDERLVHGRVEAQQRLVGAPRGARHVAEHDASLEGLHERRRLVCRLRCREAHAEPQ